MLHEPILILSLLVFIEGAVFFLSDNSSTGRFFKYLPSMFWIYFLPMLANTLGIIPEQNQVYGDIVTWCLPASLVLLLLGINLGHIFKLGRVVLAVMFAGVLGIIIGGPCVLLIYKHWLPENAWMGIGALSASWIGGSANMIAVKEAIGTPDNVFLPVVIVDTIVPYFWMGILIALSAYQSGFDKWNKSNPNLLNAIFDKTKEYQSSSKSPLTAFDIGQCLLMAAILTASLSFLKFTSQTCCQILTERAFIILGVCVALSLFIYVIAAKHGKYGIWNIFIILFIAIIVSIISIWLSARLPAVKNFINKATWAVIISTSIGILLSFTGLRRLEDYCSSKIGFALLYFVLASIGAKANLSHIKASPAFLLAGVTWIMIHALFLFISTKLLRSPLSLAAAASQAAIGGPASAPVVAGIYHPKLAAVGLLLAVLGNILGTGLGFLCSQLCRFVSNL